MAAIQPYSPQVIRFPKDASTIPAWDGEASLYIRVNLETLAYLRGITSLAIHDRFFTGTEQEIDTALDALRQQISEPVLTKEDICQDEPTAWGAEFRAPRDEGGAAMLQVRQGEGLPVPPWEFRMREGEDGIRYIEYRSEGSESPFIPITTLKVW